MVQVALAVVQEALAVVQVATVKVVLLVEEMPMVVVLLVEEVPMVVVVLQVVVRVHTEGKVEPRVELHMEEELQHTSGVDAMLWNSNA